MRADGVRQIGVRLASRGGDRRRSGQRRFAPDLRGHACRHRLASRRAIRRAPHHGYGTIAAGDRYSAGRFVEDARATINDVIARNKLPILVGGTGLYIEALAGSMPLDRPIAGDELRARVRHEADVHPHAALRSWLEAIAPDAAHADHTR